MTSFAWEKQFGDLVKDTENHLAKARHKLDKSRSGHKSLFTSYRARDRGVRDNWYDGSTTLPAAHQSFNTGVTSARFPIHSLKSNPSPRIPEHVAHETGVLASLSEQLDRQTTSIEELTQKVHRLEIEKERSHTHLHDLEREVQTLNKRLNEGGIHLQTEQKLDRWHHDIRLQLDDLQGQVERSSRGGSITSQDDLLLSLAQELHDSKRQLQTECDALHREIETLRSKLVRHEADMTGKESQHRELKRQIDELRQNYQSQMYQLESQICRLSRVSSHIQVEDVKSLDRTPVIHTDMSEKWKDHMSHIHREEVTSDQSKNHRKITSSKIKDKRAIPQKAKNSASARYATKKFFSAPQISRNQSSSSLSDESLSDEDEFDIKPRNDLPTLSKVKGDLRVSDLDVEENSDEDGLLDYLESSVSLDSDSLH